MRAFFAQSTFTLDLENAGDVVAREQSPRSFHGPDRRKKSSKLRRGRVPAERLALVARDRAGHVIGTVRLWNIEAGVGSAGNPSRRLRCCSVRLPSTRGYEGKGIGSALMRAAIPRS